MNQTAISVLPTDNQTERISISDPRSAILSVDLERMSGVPCFAGTRVPVQDLWDYLAGGESLDSFLDSFPTVSRQQAISAIRMAGEKLIEGLELK